MTRFFKTHVLERDVALFYRIHLSKGVPLWDRIMKGVSMLFDVGTYSAIMGGVFLLLIANNAPLKAPLLLFSISQIITHGVKRIFGRKRPFENLANVDLAICAPKDIYSFPSGHTTAAVTLAIILGMWQPLLYVPMMLLAALCGISRIYLGVHYPTDVIIGAFIPLLTKWIFL